MLLYGLMVFIEAFGDLAYVCINTVSELRAEVNSFFRSFSQCDVKLIYPDCCPLM